MIRIDPRSSTPPFEQLRVQLLAQIHEGELASGSRLPTVRRLADDLGLAPNTVARCYRELEQAGVIETHGRNGTVVAWSSDTSEAELQRAAAALVEQARALGIPISRARSIVEAAFRG
ncbi:GntR family transcriptional regulator [Pseudolysinimonas kribbensis]|jgi:DNA-binding transcriptional regulator YhcF (GntR family)|uniref:GntR family transcriptional regulator n=1 Tax=Pseudolysinimonas kribbensis TaxID=433641 RepID=A0ABQ6JZ88_9MICO|nr:GntR family transcriptional regulator [Pseudolysinimonas kribbensis]GMA93329.1 GntR family transcriptional regulator [Pseudolysinimonas kribbensis]